MFNGYLEQMSSIYDNMDSVLIINEKGYVEYAAFINEDKETIENIGYTGKHLFEVYPNMTPETSSVFQVMKTGEPIIEEMQTQLDYTGNVKTFSCSTYPIGLGDKIIGAISGAVYLDKEGKPSNTTIHRRKEFNTKRDHLYRIDDIITEDEQMDRLKERILRIAAGDSPVMIIGDTGTGKELVAQSVHSHSHRVGGPFISQNCSAIPIGLLESTLFGTSKGAYTGAEDRKGLFELADGGSLFLDELNSMEIGLQGKILKAIEDQQIRRVGDEKIRKINVRIISALNHDPKTLIEEGLMRSDLYYRLGVVQLRLPNLIERKSDIPVLINYFIKSYNRTTGRHISGYSDLALAVMLNHTWPGNIRELRNAVEYGFNISADDILTISDIPDNVIYDSENQSFIPQTEFDDANLHYEQLLTSGHSLTELVESYEEQIIRYIINNSKNTTEAASKLGISRPTLRYKLSKYEIE